MGTLWAAIDTNDAEGICEAVSRPNMRFVPIKSFEQQDMQSLHRIREQLIKQRTAMANQIRVYWENMAMLFQRALVISASVCLIF
ncbi:MAG: transposase [Magnetococcales bacterium]|nr:transposase [Magnetococcales bacterium]